MTLRELLQQLPKGATLDEIIIAVADRYGNRAAGGIDASDEAGPVIRTTDKKLMLTSWLGNYKRLVSMSGRQGGQGHTMNRPGPQPV